MADNFNQNQIQSVIGYFFKDDTVLMAAFTHSSRAVYGEETNERLSFLGRKLFDVIVCDYIFSRSAYSTEAKLEAQLDSYRMGNVCENYVKEHNLDKYIRISELSNVAPNNKSVSCDTFFAIVGAIYRDGGMPSLKGFLLPLLRVSDGESAHSSDASRVYREKSYVKDKSDKNEGKKYKSYLTYEHSNTVSSVQKNEHKSTQDVGPEPEAKPVRKPFIRDALAPVRLPDSMRTKKEPYTKKKRDNGNTLSEDSENYKSMLQELIQKNIRTANVLLKYQTSFVKDGIAKTEVSLYGKTLASAEHENKRMSERLAAKNAYEALKDNSSRAYKEFSSFCQGGINISEQNEDYISKLNQYYQRTEHSSSAPLTYEKRQSTDKKSFCVALLHNGKEIAAAKGETLKLARQNAAKMALEHLGII